MIRVLPFVSVLVAVVVIGVRLQGRTHMATAAGIQQSEQSKSAIEYIAECLLLPGGLLCGQLLVNLMFAAQRVVVERLLTRKKDASGTPVSRAWKPLPVCFLGGIIIIVGTWTSVLAVQSGFGLATVTLTGLIVIALWVDCYSITICETNFAADDAQSKDLVIEISNQNGVRPGTSRSRHDNKRRNTSTRRTRHESEDVRGLPRRSTRPSV